MPKAVNRVVAKSAEIMVNFLIALDIGNPKIMECPFYRDFIDLRKMVKLDDLFGNQRLRESISVIETKAGAFHPDDLLLCDESVDNEFRRDKDCLFGKLLQRLAPIHADRKRSLAVLMIKVVGRENLRQTLNMLFSFKIRDVKSLKLQHGDSETFLLLVGDNHTPAVLSCLHQRDWANVFYPVYTDNYGVWIEWGVRYDFDDPTHHRLLQDREYHTVLIKRTGDKIQIPAGLNDFIRLTRIIDLNFAPQSQTNMTEPKAFKAPELEFTLELRRDDERSLRRQELERLRRREREIQERIEWLRDIEAIYDEDKQYRVMFYPFSADRRDPVFPHFFFRNQSIRKLRRMKFYHGHIGSLGEGTLVGSSSFLHCEDDAAGHEILQHFNPIEGMVFLSNPHWMKAAQLRILTPAGFDLYPYLDMDDTDRQTIVRAFIDTAVWGVNQISSQGVGKKKQSAAELKVIGEQILSKPEEYLYFILSPEPVSHVAGQRPRLEGLIIHESDFNAFDFRFQNLGIHFSTNDEDQNIIYADLEKTIVSNVVNSFNHCIERLDGALEKGFRKERGRLKEKIETFNAFVKDTQESMAKSKETLNQTIAEIKEREEAINNYELYLYNRVGDFSKLMDENNKGFASFFKVVSNIAASIATDLKDMFSVHEEEFKTKYEYLQKFQEMAEKTDQTISKMLQTGKETSEAYDEMKQIEAELSAEFDGAQWKSMGLQENNLKMWKLGDACRGLNEMMNQLEHYKVAMHAAGKKTALSMTARNNKGAWEWLHQSYRRMGQLVEDSTTLNGNSGKLQTSIMRMEGPVRIVLQEIENAVRELKAQRVRSRDDRELYNTIDEQFRKLHSLMYRF